MHILADEKTSAIKCANSNIVVGGTNSDMIFCRFACAQSVRVCIVVLHFTHNTQTHVIYLHTPELHMRLCVASLATTHPQRPNPPHMW